MLRPPIASSRCRPDASGGDAAWITDLQNRFFDVRSAMDYVGFDADELSWVEERPRYQFCLNVAVADRMRSLLEGGRRGDFEAIARIYFPDRRELSAAARRFPRTGIGEEQAALADNVYQFYPDRVLLRINGFCASLCRYCFVRHKVSGSGSTVGRAAFDDMVEKLRGRPGVRDLILSGGDPLLLSDSWMRYVLERVDEVPSLRVVRFDTKVPNTLPSRITDELVLALSQLEQTTAYVNIHFSHVAELDASVERAARKLRRAGCVLGAHIPLLRGVNDSPSQLRSLCQALLEIGVRPYMLLQYIPTDGADHWRVPVEEGQAIIDEVWGSVSGLAVPHYVAYLPHGEGKALLTPNHLEGEGIRSKRGTVFPLT